MQDMKMRDMMKMKDQIARRENAERENDGREIQIAARQSSGHEIARLENAGQNASF